MSEREQPDEETRRIAYKNVPAWAIEAGWEDPDAKPRTAEAVLHLRETTVAHVAALRAVPRYHSDRLGTVTIPEE